MNNLPDNPQPISPELQAKQHTQQLLSKLDELKKEFITQKQLSASMKNIVMNLLMSNL